MPKNNVFEKTYTIELKVRLALNCNDEDDITVVLPEIHEMKRSCGPNMRTALKNRIAAEDAIRRTATSDTDLTDTMEEWICNKVARLVDCAEEYAIHKFIHRMAESALRSEFRFVGKALTRVTEGIDGDSQ